MMTIFRIGHFQCGWMLATALAVLWWPAVSQAYTPEQEQACTSDAFRLCSSEIPDVDRVTACMAARKAQLSPPCRAQFRPDPEPVAAAGRPVNIRPAGVKPAKPVSTKRKVKKPARPAAT